MTNGSGSGRPKSTRVRIRNMGSGETLSIRQRHRSPDPYQSGMDPQHWFLLVMFTLADLAVSQIRIRMNTPYLIGFGHLLYVSRRANPDEPKRGQRPCFYLLERQASEPVPEFIDPVFTKTSPKRSFSLNRKRAFWLVFAKTGSIISGTGFWIQYFGQGSGTSEHCTEKHLYVSVTRYRIGTVQRSAVDPYPDPYWECGSGSRSREIDKAN